MSALMILLSCTHSGEDTSGGSAVYKWNYSEDKLYTLFERVEYTPIEDHPDGLFKKADKLILHNNKYYIFDYLGENVINVFDRKGAFLYRIGSRGEGPGEYIKIRAFTVKGNLLYLIDEIAQKMKTYNAGDGTFVEEKELFRPAYLYDLVVADNGDFLFAQQQLHTEKGAIPDSLEYNVFITSPDLKIKHRLFPFREDDCAVTWQMDCFKENEDHLIFHPLVVDSVVLFDRKSPSDAYSVQHFDFGSKKAPRECYNDFEVLTEHTYFYDAPSISSRYMIGTFHRSKSLGRGPYIYKYDKELVFGENSYSTEHLSGFLFCPLLVEKDTIYSMYDHAYFNLWDKENMTSGLPADIREHLQEGSDVLVKYILK